MLDIVKNKNTVDLYTIPAHQLTKRGIAETTRAWCTCMMCVRFCLTLMKARMLIVTVH